MALAIYVHGPHWVWSYGLYGFVLGWGEVCFGSIESGNERWSKGCAMFRGGAKSKTSNGEDPKSNMRYGK